MMVMLNEGNGVTGTTIRCAKGYFELTRNSSRISLIILSRLMLGNSFALFSMWRYNNLTFIPMTNPHKNSARESVNHMLLSYNRQRTCILRRHPNEAHSQRTSHKDSKAVTHEVTSTNAFEQSLATSGYATVTSCEKRNRAAS